MPSPFLSCPSLPLILHFVIDNDLSPKLKEIKALIETGLFVCRPVGDPKTLKALSSEEMGSYKNVGEFKKSALTSDYVSVLPYPMPLILPFTLPSLLIATCSKYTLYVKVRGPRLNVSSWG